MPFSWQKVVYTPPIYITIRLPLVSRYFCRSIRVRGRWNTPKPQCSLPSEWEDSSLLVRVAMPAEVCCEIFGWDSIWTSKSLMGNVWRDFSTCQESTRNIGANFEANFGENVSSFASFFSETLFSRRGMLINCDPFCLLLFLGRQRGAELRAEEIFVFSGYFLFSNRRLERRPPLPRRHSGFCSVPRWIFWLNFLDAVFVAFTLLTSMCRKRGEAKGDTSLFSGFGHLLVTFLSLF